MLRGKKVQTVAAERQALGEREGILDGQSHVGHTQLRLDGSVVELHGRVDNALRMNQHLYLRGLDTEEPLGLDDLEALVHHRRGIDGDLRTHVPGGMAQGIGLGDLGNLLHREVAERTA